MAAGDAVTVWTSVATGVTIDVRPGSGVEWALFKFEGAAEFEVYKTDGSTPALIVPAGATNTPAVISDAGGPFRATNSVYYRLKNTNAGTKMLGYSGTVTK